MSDGVVFVFLNIKAARKVLFFILQEEARQLIEKAVDFLTFAG